MLSSKDIKHAINEDSIKIENYSEDCLRPSSYLLRINNVILEKKDNDTVIDTKKTNTNDLFIKKTIDQEGFIMKPRTFYLLSSFEMVSLSNKHSALLNQLSSMARIGLSTDFSSNLVAATFGNQSPSSITFEVINLSESPIRIYPFVKFCHISFFKHSTPTENKYNGIYAGRDLPTPSNFAMKPSR